MKKILLITCILNCLNVSSQGSREMLKGSVWREEYRDVCNYTFFTKDSVYLYMTVHSLDTNHACYNYQIVDYLKDTTQTFIKEMNVREVNAYGFSDSMFMRYGEDSLKDSGRYMYQYSFSFKKDSLITDKEDPLYSYKPIGSFTIKMNAEKTQMILEENNGPYVPVSQEQKYYRLGGLPKKVIEALKLRGISEKDLPPAVEPVKTIK